jgi:hypothetical protein
LSCTLWPSGASLATAGPGLLDPARQVMVATTAAMALAALLVALFTCLTVALLPSHVPQRPPVDRICHGCEPATTVIPPSLRAEYEPGENVGHTGGSTLLVVPLVGAGIAAGGPLADMVDGARALRDP